MASWRTSAATTAKPRPCSPARAVFHSGVQRQDVGLKQCCRSPRSLPPCGTTAGCSAWCAPPGPSRCCLAVATADAWLATCSARAAVSVDWQALRYLLQRSGRLLQAGCRASVRSTGRHCPAQSRGLPGARSGGLAHLHHQGAQGFLHGVQGQQQLACPIPVVPFDVLAQVQAGHALGRGVGRADGREMLRTSHQVSTPPSSRAVAQTGSAPPARVGCFVQSGRPLASIASRCDCASCCNDPSRAAALGSKRSVNTLRMRSVRPKSRAVTSSLTAARKSAPCRVPVSRACPQAFAGAWPAGPSASVGVWCAQCRPTESRPLGSELKAMAL